MEKIDEILNIVDPNGEIPIDKREEIVERIKSRETKGEPVTVLTDGSETMEEFLKKQISSETDWRKKSALAAKLIKLNIDRD